MGSTIEDNIRMVGLALRSGLRPELVVLCLGPASLSARINILDDPVSPDLAALREHVAERHPMLAKEDIESFLLVPLNRAFPNRSRIGRWTRVSLFDARLDLFGARLSARRARPADARPVVGHDLDDQGRSRA